MLLVATELQGELRDFGLECTRRHTAKTSLQGGGGGGGRKKRVSEAGCRVARVAML